MTASSPASSFTTAAEVPGADLPAARVIGRERGARAIAARPFPDWITLAGGSAWVANVGSGIGRYDAATGKLRGSVPAGTEICLGMDVGYGSLWAGDCANGRLVRVDTSSAKVQARIKLPFEEIAEESSVAAGESAVFVMSAYPERIARIDPTTNKVTSTFRAPESPSALRAGYGALWVTNAYSGRLTRVDPATGKQQARIDLPDGAGFLALGEGSVWVMSNATGVVSRVNPRTNRVVASILASPDHIDGGDIAVGGGYVWARVSDVLVAKIDPRTNTVVARYGPGSGSGSVAADRDALWVSAHDVTTVWRVPLSRG